MGVKARAASFEAQRYCRCLASKSLTMFELAAIPEHGHLQCPRDPIVNVTLQMGEVRRVLQQKDTPHQTNDEQALRGILSSFFASLSLAYREADVLSPPSPTLAIATAVAARGRRCRPDYHPPHPRLHRCRLPHRRRHNLDHHRRRHLLPHHHRLHRHLLRRRPPHHHSHPKILRHRHLPRRHLPRRHLLLVASLMRGRYYTTSSSSPPT